MRSKTGILAPGSVYHIYNRANGNETLFRSAENYRYFLEKYIHYISPVADTFCYCLMPNHFHFLVRISEEEVLTTLTGFRTLSGLNKQQALSKYTSQQFSHLFNGYTQAFNKQHGRKGTLFMRPFKRITVKELKYLQKLVHYIHYNPVEAGLCKTPENWCYSSYPSILSGQNQFLQAAEVISWFEDLNNFKYIHSKQFPSEPARL